MSTVTTTEAVAIPGYRAGTWKIDPSHSDVSFTVRHMMVSKVRGNFRTFSGTIVTGEHLQDSSVTASVDLASIDTNSEQRDAHLRSADFFSADEHPEMTYRSTGLQGQSDDLVLQGQLTLKGVTRPVPLHLELNGFGPDPFGGTRLGLTATGEISRKDFGVNWNAAIDGGGVVVGDKVQLHLEIEAVLEPGTTA